MTSRRSATSRLAAFAVASMAVGACSSSDSSPTTSDPAPVTSGQPAPPEPTGPASTGVPVSDPEPTFQPVDPSLTAPPASSTSDPGPTPYDELAEALPAVGELELPASWVTRQLDPTIPLDAALTEDFDPFLGLLVCEDGVLRGGPDDVWVERSIVGPDLPEDDGLLSVRMTIERQTDEEYAADIAGLAACRGSSEQVLVDRSTAAIVRPGGPIEVNQVRLTSPATEAVPFPSAFAFVNTREGDATVSVLMYGLDVGQDWTSRSEQVAGRILDRAN